MARPLDPGLRQAIAARLQYYRDMGITDFYRRAASAAQPQPAEPSAPGTPGPGVVTTPPPHEAQNRRFVGAPAGQMGLAIYGQQPPPADRAAGLRAIREDIGECTRCVLHRGRKNIVFGVGNPYAELMFVGEGPGADEDIQGEPFVGRAGQLLNNMIQAMGLKRQEVYIANVVKCRPPGNRTPEREEIDTCSPFLLRQIDVVRPKVIVALGAVAARTLLGLNEAMANLRGRWYDFRGSRLLVTYHPAFLLRDPRRKKDAWEDLKLAMRELGLGPRNKA